MKVVVYLDGLARCQSLRWELCGFHGDKSPWGCGGGSFTEGSVAVVTERVAGNAWTRRWRWAVISY